MTARYVQFGIGSLASFVMPALPALGNSTVSIPASQPVNALNFDAAHLPGRPVVPSSCVAVILEDAFVKTLSNDALIPAVERRNLTETLFHAVNVVYVIDGKFIVPNINPLDGQEVLRLPEKYRDEILKAAEAHLKQLRLKEEIIGTVNSALEYVPHPIRPEQLPTHSLADAAILDPTSAPSDSGVAHTNEPTVKAAPLILSASVLALIAVSSVKVCGRKREQQGEL